MATVLPRINPGGMMTVQSPTLSHSHHMNDPYGVGIDDFGINGGRRITHREAIERNAEKRLQMKTLSRRETAAVRKSYFHNMCVDILKHGFNKSFIEIFSLTEQQNQRRLQAGPESLLWTQVMLENEIEKLDVLRKFLCQAEAAERRGKLVEVYRCQNQLAVFFVSTNDKWLSDHYFAQCLQTSEKLPEDDRSFTAEGHCNVALSQEENGDILAAMDNFEAFYKLSTDQPWELSSGQSMFTAACDHLSRVYSAMAEIQEKDEKPVQQLEFLRKAYEMALEGGDRKWTGEASYKLGNAYNNGGHPETALQCFKQYLEICQQAKDDAGIARACEAIGRAYESEGKTEECVKYYEMFLEVAEKMKDDTSISKASNCLGQLFNKVSKYDQAAEFFNRSYSIARAQNNPVTIGMARVYCGIASAHKMLNNYNQFVETSDRSALERLVEWKDNRAEDFEDHSEHKED